MFIAEPGEALQDVMEINFGFQIESIGGIAVEEKKEEKDEKEKQEEEKKRRKQVKTKKVKAQKRRKKENLKIPRRVKPTSRSQSKSRTGRSRF